MSYPSTSSEPSEIDDSARQNAVSMMIFLGAAVAFLLRFAISPQIVDRFVNYTAENGAFYEKLHVGSYAIFLMALVALLSRPFFLKADEITKFRALARFSLWLLALITYLVVSGRPGSSGVLIDTYLVAGAAGLTMLTLNEGYRRALGDVTLILLIVSAVIGIVEVATKHRLLPYDFVELQFRPIGLADHPLGLGALCATAIGFVPLTRWRVWVKVALVFVLLIGCAASGARFALLTSAAEILLILTLLPWPGLVGAQARRAKFAVLLFVLVGGVALVAVLFSAGLLNRFGTTIFDENFLARVSIYDVFNYVSWTDVVFGMRGDVLLAIVNTKLGLPAIESAPVVITLALGLPLAVFFAILFFWIVVRLLQKAPLAAWIGTFTFLLASLSNNTLSSKTPVVAILIVLLIAYAIPKSRHAEETPR